FLAHCFDEWLPADRDRLIGAWIARRRIAREWIAFQAVHPLVLAPVLPHPPFEVGFDVRGRAEAVETARRLRVNTVANLLGLPSAAVPVGVAAGLPQGVQLIGPYGREDLCLDAAEAVERALGTLTPIDPKGA